MVTKISNGRIVSPDGVLTGYSLYFENGKILDISKEEYPFDFEIDAENHYVAPGFIDVHVHGGGGFDFMDGGADAIVQAANFHLQTGTTSIMPTSLACSFDTLTDFLKDLRMAQSAEKLMGTILGAHLEGPYFAKSQAGAQNPDYITPPKPEDYQKILKEFGDLIWVYDEENPPEMLPGAE